MKILRLHKSNKVCACGCGKELQRMDLVNKTNGKYFDLHCGKLYRLHTEAVRWIRGMVNGKAN